MWAGDGADMGRRMVRRQAADLAPGCLYWILDKCHLGSGPDRGRAGSAAAASRVSRLHTYHIQPSHPQPGTEDLEIIKIVKI